MLTKIRLWLLGIITDLGVTAKPVGLDRPTLQYSSFNIFGPAEDEAEESKFRCQFKHNQLNPAPSSGPTDTLKS
jgi:hypothetical protein